MRHMLDVWGRLPALWTQALGPRASRQTAPFIQNHCQKKKQTHKGGRWHTLQKNCGSLQLVTHFCEKCHFMWLNRRAFESLLRGLAECGCESYFILIYLFVDEYTHSSQTYRGHYATLKWCQGNKRASAASVVVNWNDEQMAVTQQPKPPVSFFLLMIQCSWMNYEHHLHSLLLPGYAVTHYIATITMLKLCMHTVAALKSFHLPACLHHQRICQTHCAWLEMNCGQCIPSQGPWRCEDKWTIH